MNDVSNPLSELEHFIVSHSFLETHRLLEFSDDISQVSGEDITNILRVADSSPNVFSYLSFDVLFPDEAPQSLISTSHNGITNSISTEAGGRDVSEISKRVSYYLSEDDYSGLTSYLLENISEDGTIIQLECGINKYILSQSIRQRYDDIRDIEVSIWTSTQALQAWAQEEDITEAISELFPTDKLTICVFFQLPEESVDSVPLFIRYESIEGHKQKIQDLRDRYLQYSRNNKSNNNTLFPPSFAFDSSIQRTTLSDLLAYSFFAPISDQLRVESRNLIVDINARKGVFQGDISLTDLKDDENSLKSLSNLYSHSVERAQNDLYSEFWRQAIVEHCRTMEDLFDRDEDIIRYYRSLEEEAIAGNFDQLSGAVQDAQIFISDVTNSLSQSTLSLSSEVQKVVFAIFGVLLGNIFLLVREASVNTSMSFTAVTTAGLLLFYFPTAQKRVDEIDNILDEGRKDADLYSNMLRKLGSDEFVDVREFEDRHESYMDLAEERIDWTNKQLRRAFRLVGSIWLISGIFALFTFTITSLSFWAIILTIPASIWIRTNHMKYKYTGSHNTVEIAPFIGRLPNFSTILLFGLSSGFIVRIFLQVWTGFY